MILVSTPEVIRSPKAVPLFGIGVHAVTMRQTVDLLSSWMRMPAAQCRIVVTPNLDHIVQLQSNEKLRRAYAAASLIIADGWPIVFASRLLRRPLPERVPGSGLVPKLLGASQDSQPTRVFLLGAAPGVAERATVCVSEKYPAVEICGTYSPPLGFEHDAAENQEIFTRLNDAYPDLLIVGLGAPKQELWLTEHQDKIAAKVAIAAGATIDFLAGEQTRAPHWVQAIYMEWLHRLATNPRRLAGRYLKDAVLFPWLLLKEICGR